MEHIHGIDVSWMTHGNPKDTAIKAANRQRSQSQQARESQARGSQAQESPVPSPAPSSPTPSATNGQKATPPAPTASTTAPKPVPLSRPSSYPRPASGEKNASPTGASPQRRNSWFSSLSSKFSSNAGGQSPPQANNAPAKQAELSVPKASPIKNAVLQPAAKYEGEGPYTPAPPKSTPAGLLQVFRRLSTSSNLAPSMRGINHGLVERRVLNVNRDRERCSISDLKQSKLRRVAFCVDVEVAPMPKYADADGNGAGVSEKTWPKDDKSQKRKIAEKGEGEALKHPKAVEEQKEDDGEVKATGERLPKEPEKEGTEPCKEAPAAEAKGPVSEAVPTQKTTDTKKKDKKKKSEEERKTRKEKKRRLAEANGTIPMEIHFDSDSSESSTPTSEGPRPQNMPTTNPVRIYRRCCQLRETPILKKITEQLMDTANFSAESGMVEKLDLTGYWMQLADLVTLGDYLAVVPVKEVILENCGLTDEGLRVVLAGLLAVRKSESRRRKKPISPDDLSSQGGVVERLVLKNNKFGPEGWKHLSLFIYLCRSLKILDLSSIPFPQPSKRAGTQANGTPSHPNLCQLFARSLRDRLGGSTLGLLSLGETGLSTEQLGSVVDGVIECGVKRLGVAHNNIDAEGVQHIAKYLRSGKCEGLDLGGNDMRDQLEVLADALTESCHLGALSLAECNLEPSSLSRLLPKLAKLQNFRFLDLSHNRELFDSGRGAISALRRYLPKFATLKRIHLADCAMSPEQAIALAEVLPEIPGLAHISFLQNPKIAHLTNTKTEEAQEEAFALFASLLAATRLSTGIVCIDIEVPGEQSSDLLKAMAKQVVAYCLRNMERLPVSELAAATLAQTEASARHDAQYPDVLQHLVGRDVNGPPELDTDLEVAPDDDYVIGGTGVVKALTCCLQNRGDESRRQSGEFTKDLENGTPISKPRVSPGKAKDMSKHLLSTARKIRLRLQPALVKAKETPGEDAHAYQRLLFLDNILKGIIKRFEDEFPETREPTDSAVAISLEAQPGQVLGSSPSSTDADLFPPAILSDAEDEPDYTIKSPSLSRSNSVISTTSKALANEEGRVLRAGHKFRSGIVKPEAYMLLSGVEMVGADPNHVRVLHEMLGELGDEELLRKADEIGPVRVFQEDKDLILHQLREADPEHWERFAESQEMARKNVKLDEDKCPKSPVNGAAVMEGDKPDQVSEEAVVVD